MLSDIQINSELFDEIAAQVITDLLLQKIMEDGPDKAADFTLDAAHVVAHMKIKLFGEVEVVE